MKHSIAIGLVLSLFAGGAVSAQVQQGRVILDSDANETANTGERVMQPDFGAGTTDTEEEVVQYEESDLDFLRERAAEVSVSAVEVRGWDIKKKEAFLETVREHAQVRSGEDLENFAQGVLLRHEEIDSIETNAASVSVRSRAPARLFGIFRTSIEHETTITFGDGQRGSRVKVKFPWMRFLYRVDDRYQQSAMDERFLPEVNDEVLVGFEHGDATSSAQASVIQKLLDFWEKGK
jgi:hypothetical protein